jgi:hypothetical protein
MTRPFPLVNDVEKAQKPAHAPLWEGTLEDGDLLYIPRGWWHVALPLAEPTLHLTVGIHKRTGLDLLRWLAERMRASEIFRQDLPHIASASGREAHVARMREELLAEFDRAVLERFYEDQDAQAAPRARLSLPLDAMPQAPTPALDARVRLLAPRPLSIEAKDGGVVFYCMKRRWRFAEGALPVLRLLDESRECTVAELCETARGSVDEQTVRAFVSELSRHGLVTITKG